MWLIILYNKHLDNSLRNSRTRVRGIVNANFVNVIFVSLRHDTIFFYAHNLWWSWYSEITRWITNIITTNASDVYNIATQMCFVLKNIRNRSMAREKMFSFEDILKKNILLSMVFLSIQKILKMHTGTLYTHRFLF